MIDCIPDYIRSLIHMLEAEFKIKIDIVRPNTARDYLSQGNQQMGRTGTIVAGLPVPHIRPEKVVICVPDTAPISEYITPRIACAYINEGIIGHNYGGASWYANNLGSTPPYDFFDREASIYYRGAAIFPRRITFTAGWIGMMNTGGRFPSTFTDVQKTDEHIRVSEVLLRRMLSAPCLGVVPPGESAETLSPETAVTRLMETAIHTMRETARSEATRVTEEVTRLVTQVTAAIQRQRGIASRLALLESGRDGDLEAMTTRNIERFRALVSNGMFQRISIIGDTVTGETADMIVENPTSSTHDAAMKVNAGSYRVTVSDICRIFANGQQFDNYIHPHVSQSVPCWGDAALDAARLTGQSAYADTLELAWNLLRTYNHAAPYIGWNRWLSEERATLKNVDGTALQFPDENPPPAEPPPPAEDEQDAA